MPSIGFDTYVIVGLTHGASTPLLIRVQSSAAMRSSLVFHVSARLGMSSTGNPAGLNLS